MVVGQFIESVVHGPRCFQWQRLGKVWTLTQGVEDPPALFIFSSGLSSPTSVLTSI